MKGLLQSKRFKDNLRKWLFMYVGTLCLLTSVITYSKYISSMNGSDSARAAKFIIGIDYNYVDKCNDGTHMCNLGSSRPLKEYEFEFSVDTTELEVKTLIYLTLKPGDGFTLPDKVEEISSTGSVLNTIAIEEIKDQNDVLTKNKKLSLTVEANDQTVRYYRVKLAYDNTDPSKYKSDIGSINAFSVDYSAKQLD